VSLASFLKYDEAGIADLMKFTNFGFIRLNSLMTVSLSAICPKSTRNLAHVKINCDLSSKASIITFDFGLVFNPSIEATEVLDLTTIFVRQIMQVSFISPSMTSKIS